MARRWIGSIAVLAVAIVAAATNPAHADFIGSVTRSGGTVHAEGGWNLPGSADVILSWDISDNGNGTWHYAYTFSHDVGNTSHFILETSDNVVGSDFQNVTAGLSVVMDTYSGADPSNPSMPGSIYGAKFNGTTGLTTSIAFDIARAPTWGDFYSKDGKHGLNGEFDSAWNTGLLAGELAGNADGDPTSAPTNGSLNGHILVPDSTSFVTEDTSLNPEPSSIVLIGMGSAGLFGFIRRQRAKAA